MIRAAMMAVLFSKSNNGWSYETETLKAHIVHIDFAHHSKKLKFLCGNVYTLTFLFCVCVCVCVCTCICATCMSVYAHMEAITKSVCFDVGWRYVRMPFLCVYWFIFVCFCVRAFYYVLNQMFLPCLLPLAFQFDSMITKLCVCFHLSHARAHTHTHFPLAGA